MNARILNKLIVMLVIMLTSLPVAAASESSSSSDQPANGSAVLLLQYKTPRTKRMPSKNHLEVVYSDGMISLISDTYEGEFSLSFKNTLSGEFYNISSIMVGESVLLELESGEYQVNAIGEDGSVLSGFMQIY